MLSTSVLVSQNALLRLRYDRGMAASIKQNSTTQTHPELRAVIFDYGGVLSLLPTEQDWEQLARAAKISRSTLDSCYWKFREEYDRAIYNGITYWRRIAGAGGRKLTEEEATRLVAMDNHQWARDNPLTAELIRSITCRRDQDRRSVEHAV